MLAALLTQRVLGVARGRDDIPLLLFRPRSGIVLRLCYVVKFAHRSGICKVQVHIRTLFALLFFDREHFFALLVAGHAIFPNLLHTRAVVQQTVLGVEHLVFGGILLLSQQVKVLVLVISFFDLRHVIHRFQQIGGCVVLGLLEPNIKSGSLRFQNELPRRDQGVPQESRSTRLHPALSGLNPCLMLSHGLHQDHRTCDLGRIDNTSIAGGIRQFLKNGFVPLRSETLHFLVLLDVMAPAFLLEFVQDKSDIAPHDAVDLFLLHFFGVENPFLILILVIFAW